MAYQFRREPLSTEETDRLMNACQTAQEKLVIFGILETGLRVGEFISLTPLNFRWQEGFLVVDGKGGPFGKMTKKRSVPLSERAKQIFTAHFTMNDRIGFSKKTAERVVKRVANRANIQRPCCPHVLRHTFASNCIRKGINVVTVNKMLGHDNLETTMIYLNVQPEDIRKDFKDHW